MDTALICFGTFSVTICCLFFTDISNWLRFRIHKGVKCWFCHVGSRVKYIDSNSWTCSSCGQYNGFTKDGDYNKEIPGQYDDRLNVNFTTFKSHKSDFKRENSLCPQCNYYQELKVKQLAAFVPINEANYDTEVEHYRLQLEQSYKLCKKCDKLIEKIISSQKYKWSGPRRLAYLHKKLVFKSRWTLYTSMLLSLLMITHVVASIKPLPESNNMEQWAHIFKDFGNPLMNQILTGLGVVLHTLQCCQFGSYWSFISWLTWAALASSPHFLQNQLPEHICYVQMGISFSMFFSTLIILIRMIRNERAVKTKDATRLERRKKEDSTATWSSPSSSYSNSFMGNGSSGKKKQPSPIKLSSKSSPCEIKSSTKSDLLKPVPRLPEEVEKRDELDISSLSIGSKCDNPFAKASSFIQSPWDRVTLTRSSSNSSGISSLRASPLSWRPNQMAQPSPGPSFMKHPPPRSSPLPTSNENDWTKNCTLNTLKDLSFTRQNDMWTPMARNQWDVQSNYDHNSDWDFKKTSWGGPSDWPMHVYSYPVTYAWPGVSPQWNRSPDVSSRSVNSDSLLKSEITNSNSSSSFITSLPIIVLAATNAILVYYILGVKA